jgi:hypothetical protein
MPDFSSIDPININRGMARRMILVIFSRIDGGKSIRNCGPFIIRSEAIPTAPRVNATGALRMKRTTTATNIKTTINAGFIGHSSA